MCEGNGYQSKKRLKAAAAAPVIRTEGWPTVADETKQRIDIDFQKVGVIRRWGAWILLIGILTPAAITYTKRFADAHIWLAAPLLHVCTPDIGGEAD
jgi:hypothetical protein